MMKNLESKSTATFETYITHALMPPWKEILELGQLQTWAPKENEQVRHIYAHPVPPLIQAIDNFYWRLKWSRVTGRGIAIFEVLISRLILMIQPNIVLPQNSYTERDAIIDIPDLLLLSNVKSIAIHKFASRSEADFVVFTTTSSYINQKLLQSVLDGLPRQNLIAGRVVLSKEKQFISGSFRVFSPDVLLYTMQNLENYKTWLAEDLAMGHLMQQEGFNFFNLKSLDIRSLSDLKSIPSAKLIETVHFRVKSGSFVKRNDVEIMLALHQRLQELEAL